MSSIINEFKIGNIHLIHGDMLKVIPELIEIGIRVQSLVTDPPYHLTSTKGGKKGFMGSGSGAISAYEEGFSYIGIELEEEYFKIAKARLLEATKQGKLDL